MIIVFLTSPASFSVIILTKDEPGETLIMPSEIVEIPDQVWPPGRHHSQMKLYLVRSCNGIATVNYTEERPCRMIYP
jgi:hypothetical protein